MHAQVYIVTTKYLNSLKSNSMIKSALSCFALLIATATFAQMSDQLDSNELLASSQEIESKTSTITHLHKSVSNATALGANSSATGKYAVAIGSDASATEDNTMVLGGASEANRVSVGIGTSYPSSLASLDLGDKDKGLLVNRMTAQQVEVFEMSLGIAEEGMTIYNIDAGKLQTWNGVKWIDPGVKSMSLKDDHLQIDKGSRVDLSEFKDNTDEQNLTSATLDGKKLTIEIENGTPVSVDLTPVFAEYDERIRKLEEMILKSQAMDQSVEEKATIEDLPNEAGEKAILFQNSPNPVNGPTTIKYFIPEEARAAELVLRNSLGQTISTKKLSYTGRNGEEHINTSRLDAGVYYFSLFIDNERIDTKKMIVK